MRTLLICTLSATLLGCACPGAQQVRLAGCAAQGCPQRVADTPPVETKPAPVKPKVVAKKSTKFTTATKVTKKPSPDQPSKPPEKPEQKAAATTTATPAAPPATPPAPPTDTSEAVFGLPLYAGVTLVTGNTWARHGNFDIDDLRFGANVFVAADTLVGPVFVTLGAADGGRTAIYLFVGKPF